MADNVEDRDSVGALIRAVGRRCVPPREDYERVLGASRAAWQQAVRQRARRRWTYALAAGVAFVVLGAGVLRHLDDVQPTVVAGTLTTINGAVFAGSVAGEEWRWLSESGVPLLAGTRLRTDASGRAALRLLPDTSLRIAGSTDLLLQSGNRVELLEGRIYLDTSSAHSGTVEIVTRFGTLRDVGTQFEVLATGTNLRVRTREGAVTLTRGRSETVLQCDVSEELRIDSQGNIERGHIAAYDAEWLVGRIAHRTAAGSGADIAAISRLGGTRDRSRSALRFARNRSTREQGDPARHPARPRSGAGAGGCTGYHGHRLLTARRRYDPAAVPTVALIQHRTDSWHATGGLHDARETSSSRC